MAINLLFSALSSRGKTCALVTKLDTSTRTAANRHLIIRCLCQSASAGFQPFGRMSRHEWSDCGQYCVLDLLERFRGWIDQIKMAGMLNAELHRISFPVVLRHRVRFAAQKLRHGVEA